MDRIPDILLNHKSNAEARLFSLLQHVTLAGYWTAYHSLNLSEHEYKRWGEIDFLIVGPEGALALEVKGGRVRREDGIWTTTNRFDRTNHLTESPFDQAKSAMYALQKRLRDHHQLECVREKRLTWGWGVVFPDSEWRDDTPEHPPEVVADLGDMMSPKQFKAYLERLLNYWRRKERSETTATRSDLDEFRKAVRPDIDMYPALNTRVGHADTGMETLTDEQYDRLSIAEQNERIIISGGAGTGKTYVAIRMALREAAQDRSVLFVVFSPVLAAYLATLISDRLINVHSVCDLKNVDTAADVLLVDEGQDMLNLDAFEILSKSLVGGLETGRWRWFMDTNNQVGISGEFDSEALELLRSGIGGEKVFEVELNQNVRNTEEIAQAVANWTGADIGSASGTGIGREPRVIPVSSASDLAGRLSELLEELFEEGANPEHIGIVYPSGFEFDRNTLADRKFRTRLCPLDVVTVQASLRGKILHGTSADFKGLERPIIICLGFDDPDMFEDPVDLYVSTTRGNYGLYVLASESFASHLIRA